MADEVMDDRALSESMDADMANTLAEINARNAQEEVEQPQAADAPASASSPETPAAESARARDASGKFIKGETEQTAAPETVSQPSSATETTAPVAAAPTEQAIDINRPPSSWKPAAKAQWANLPADVRQEIYRREGDFHKGNSQIKENADFGQKIRTMAQPYDMLIKAEGATHEAAFDDYLKSAAMLRVGTPQQKLDLIKQLDSRYNCGLNEDFSRAVLAKVAEITGQPVQQQPQQQFQDPRVDALLRSQEQAEQQRAAQLTAQANDAETRFRAAVDDKGQPQFPFVDNVADDMVNRIPEIRRLNPSLPHFDVLKQAYEAAAWANPETRAVLLSQQAAQANQPAETLRKVEAAKRANAVNVPRRGAIPASQPNANLVLGTPESDESMRETYRQLQANN